MHYVPSQNSYSHAFKKDDVFKGNSPEEIRTFTVTFMDAVMNERLVQKLTQNERMYRERTQFLSNTAHLNKILGQSYLHQSIGLTLLNSFLLQCL